MIQLLLAILAGILTVGAPCILPVLPILLGASIGQQNRTRPLFIALGFIVTFSVLGLTLSAIATRFMLPPDTLRDIAIVALALFGFFLVWPTPFEKLITRLSGAINRANQIGQRAGSSNRGGFILGVMLALIWTPCAGPILGAILTLIATQTDIARAAILLIGYAIGAGIPMVLIAYGGQAVTTRVRAFARYTRTIQMIFGILLIALAIAMYYQYDLVWQAKLLERYDYAGLEEQLLPNLK